MKQIIKHEDKCEGCNLKCEDRDVKYWWLDSPIEEFASSWDNSRKKITWRFTLLKTPEDQWFHYRFICPIHPYSAATIQAASYDETIVIQALRTLCLYTMHSN